MLVDFITFFLVSVAKLSIARRHGRRGSIKYATTSNCFKELLKGSVIECIGVEEDHVDVKV